MTVPETIGRYEIRSELGRGGMAAVYLAYDPHFERDVAVKVLPSEFLHDPDFRARFEREAKTIAALEHPAVVPVYDFGEENGRLYLVMRLMGGGSLSGRLQGGSLPAKEVSHILVRISSALDVAHAQGIIHRDLKPGNILFDQYGEAYLSDFGIARLSEAQATLTGSKAALGTPGYMSPEQIQGEMVDARSDVYALGVILFEMLTGERPFAAESPAMVLVRQMTEPAPNIREVKPDLPPGYDQVIACSMAKEPENRPDTAGEVATLLAEAAHASTEVAARLTQAVEISVQPRPEDTASQATVVDTPPELAQSGVIENEPYSGEPDVGSGEALQKASSSSDVALMGGEERPRPRRWRWLLIVAAVLLLAAVFWVIREQGIFSPTVISEADPTPTVPGESTKTDGAQSAEPGENQVDIMARQEALPLLFEEGDFEGVVSEAGAILQENNQLPLVYLVRGMAFREMGNLDEAGADFDQALDLSPDDPAVHRELSRLYFEGQDMERALGHINIVIEQNPLDYGSYYDRGLILREMGEIRATIQNFKLYVDMVPFDECPDCHEDAQQFLDEIPERINLVLDKPVIASSETTTSELATDGNVETAWEASGEEPHWIEIDFQMPANVTLLQLIPAQDPSGRTVHRILGRRADGELQSLDEIAGFTRDGSVINIAPDPPWKDVHALRIWTVASPSPVAWREIRAFGLESGDMERPPRTTGRPGLGSETVPIMEMASEIPWLPLDADLRPATFLLAFGLEQEPFANLFLRRALALALDREHLAQVARETGFEGSRGATTFTHPDTMGRDLYQNVGISFEPDVARALLEEAGFPGGEGLPPLMLVVENHPPNLVVMENVAALWREVLGIEVELLPIEGDYFSVITAERPGLYQAEWAAEINDPDNTLRQAFHSGADFNAGGFSRGDYDEIVQEAAVITGDPLARQQLYIRAEQILNEEEAAIIPLFHYYQGR